MADEMYLLAGLPQPPHSHYGDYPQLENGIGVVRHFQVDFQRRKAHLARRPLPAGSWLMLTGRYGGQIFPPMLDYIHQRCPEVTLRLKPVENHFFGPQV